MAVRKETIRAQFTEAVQQVLEPGEHVQAGSYCVSGPSPWLAGGVGILIMALLGTRYYFVWATDRRVIFIKASFWTARPKGVAWADPRAAASIRDVDLQAAVWGKLWYRRTDGKEIRLNFHRWWLEEARQLAAILGAHAAPASPPPPPPPAAPTT
ncbi:MAG: hypothetical protein HY658_01585 [Actinobacteria bacterium]|nr:hypothetical protein [Actinomycetota bacterium]